MKKLLIFFLLLVAVKSSNAQTYYYAHTKTVYSGGRTVSQNGNSGQFVTRTSANGSKRCFDSTSNGRDHLNGTLFYVGNKNGAEVYKGPSYFGENSTYMFNDAKGLLNIKDAKGNVYVYYRKTAPAGRRASSLISSKGSVEGWSPYDNYVDPIQPKIEKETIDGKDKHNINSYRKCSACNGNGRVRVHVGTGGYGVNNTKRKCATCGKEYFTTTDHWHNCQQCGGTGRR